ncbi:hypothetical protein GCM10010218_38140 [Streptomyces mashuensis]|uniref:O-acyltransferase WSD1-like N-terminal domain-containing protein n=1 Tax=Streptomyces mashuensis TaxID=33904 RepID=A0A919ECX1_9ACTN|nr:wax ester/triacylglycerol synthase family O-acyltransferase [Streptomyces mashuensis]GHF53069.1 hypothetical protein GCM10010218_38140 [Streptomyces mashuensis]
MGGGEQRPSPLDLVFHRQPGLTVGAVLHLSGVPPSLGRLRAHVAAKLPALPALSSVLTGEGLGSRWARRPPRVADHVRERQLSIGGSLEEATRELSQAPFPVDGPRWDLTLARGWAQDRYALVFRAHHGLQDAGGVAHTLETLFSASPIPPERSSGVARALVDPPTPSLRHTAAAVRFVARTVARTDLWPHPADRCSQQRALHWAAVPTNVLRAAARRHRGTVNDAYVASVARTFTRWTAVHATHASRATLPLTVAVNVRSPTHADAPGNRTLGGRILLPGPGLPASQYLTATVAATAALKSAPHREALRRFVQGAPRWLMHPLMRSLLKPERAAILCSHVMFRHPLAWQGDPVRAVDPLVLLPAWVPALVLLYTYQGRSAVVFVTDAALPEMNTLHDVWQREAQHLDDGGGPASD